MRAHGHFPSDQASLKRLYLAILSLHPTGRARQRWSNRWRAVLNAFEIEFDGRLHPENNYWAERVESETPPVTKRPATG